VPVTLVIGTTTGLWEIATTPGQRWFRYRQPAHRLSIERPIAALTTLPDGNVCVASSDGDLWQRSPRQSRWTALRLTDTQQGQTGSTTVLAAAIDATLWRGSTPAALSRAHLTRDRLWNPCPQLHEAPGAVSWWGSDDVQTPTITAIAPDPRDANTLTVAIAIGGVYHSTDAGLTWMAHHEGITLLSPRDAEDYTAHRDVLTLSRHPSFPDILYATTESALYRGVAQGEQWHWHDITPQHMQGAMWLPSGVTTATHDRDTAYSVLPLPEDPSACTLWRTADRGQHWEAVDDAPIVPATTMTPLATSRTTGTFQILLNRVVPTRLALLTPMGDAFIKQDDTPWQYIAASLGIVTCAIWLEE